MCFRYAVAPWRISFTGIRSFNRFSAFKHISPRPPYPSSVYNPITTSILYSSLGQAHHSLLFSARHRLLLFSCSSFSLSPWLLLSYLVATQCPCTAVPVLLSFSPLPRLVYRGVHFLSDLRYFFLFYITSFFFTLPPQAGSQVLSQFACYLLTTTKQKYSFILSFSQMHRKVLSFRFSGSFRYTCKRTHVSFALLFAKGKSLYVCPTVLRWGFLRA